MEAVFSIESLLRAHISALIPRFVGLDEPHRHSVWWELKNAGQAESLLSALSREPSLSEFHPVGNMRVIGNGGSQAGVEELATWLLGRAADYGVDQALRELSKYVTSTGFEITFVTGVLAVRVDEPIQLAPTVGLIPLTR
jgi:hypothetical protein